MLYQAANLLNLKTCLSKARGGDRIVVTSNIPCTGQRLRIPDGVVLCGGYKGISLSWLSSREYADSGITTGKGIVQDLRLSGPSPHQWHDGGPENDGIEFVGDGAVYNCDITGWGHAGIYCRNGAKVSLFNPVISYCLLNGLGYGVCLKEGARVDIHNLISSFTRHAIASSADIRNYYWAYNCIDNGGGIPSNYSHHRYDVHEWDAEQQGYEDPYHKNGLCGGASFYHCAINAPNLAGIRVDGRVTQYSEVMGCNFFNCTTAVHFGSGPDHVTPLNAKIAAAVFGTVTTQYSLRAPIWLDGQMTPVPTD